MIIMNRASRITKSIMNRASRITKSCRYSRRTVRGQVFQKLPLNPLRLPQEGGDTSTQCRRLPWTSVTSHSTSSAAL